MQSQGMEGRLLLVLTEQKSYYVVDHFVVMMQSYPFIFPLVRGKEVHINVTILWFVRNVSLCLKKNKLKYMSAVRFTICADFQL